jgi:hypothetical protein
MKTKPLPTTSVASLEVGNIALVGGEWRSIAALEPHLLDAFLIIETADGRRWVRSIFSRLAVKA